MSAVIAAVHERRNAELFPPVVWRKIRSFLDDANTGQIVIDVKDGRVLACKLTDSIRVPALDKTDATGHDSDR